VYSKENEPNDAMRQVVPQTMDGYPDQDFDSDSNSVISSTSDVYEAVATISYREGLPKTWVVMNYDDWRDNDVSDDQNLVIQQVALQTPEGYPGQSPDLRCNCAIPWTSSDFGVDDTVASMSFCKGFVGVVWDDVPNSKENGLEDLTPEVESRIAEPDGPYNESTEILYDFNYERDKLDTQIEVASQFMWMPGCDTLSNLVSLVFFWFDTGWYLTIDGIF
jgi:hypothetical protein